MMFNENDHEFLHTALFDPDVRGRYVEFQSVKRPEIIQTYTTRS